MGSNTSTHTDDTERKMEEFVRGQVSGPADGSISVYALPTNLLNNNDDGMPSAETENMFERVLNKVLKEKGGHITGIQEMMPPVYLYAFGENKNE